MAKIQGKLLQQAKKLPDSSGVYFFLGQNKKILYIGKATSLKSRVRSYFMADIEEKRSPLIKKMIEEAISIKYQKTDSVLEALLLESRFIKKHKPPYNTADKDQKSFNYAVITDEKFPRVLIMRERELKIENLKLKIREAFGPFPHSKELKEALKIIRKIFPFRDKCSVSEQYSREQLSERDLRERKEIFQQKNTPITREIIAKKLSKPCFNFQIGLCPGVCIGSISAKEYAKTIKHIKTFFEGNKKKLTKDLEKEMKELAKNRDFEKAAKIKNKIFALQHIQDVSLLKPTVISYKSKVFRIESYDVAHISGTNMVGVMTVLENGDTKKSDYRMFSARGGSAFGGKTVLGNSKPNDTKALKEILERRFKHAEWQMPDLVVVDGGIAQLNVANAVLDKMKINIPIVAVTKDERHRAKEIMGMERLKEVVKIERLENQILLANSEAHRFAIRFHRKLRDAVL